MNAARGRLARAASVLAIGIAGCSGDGAPGEVEEEPAVPSAADAATVVENRGPPPATWQVGPEPILEIGAAGGHTTEELDRVAGALRLADGRIVVADGGSSEVRFFGPDGALRRRTGGAGDGPGEFRALESIGRGAGDSLWVYDFALQRLSFLDPTGAVARTAPLRPSLPNLGAVGRLPDGSFVMGQFWSAAGSAGREPGLRRLPATYVRYGPEGALLDTIGRFPGREAFLRLEDGRMTMGSVPYARAASRAVADRILWIGDQEDHEFRAYAPDGELLRIVRFPGPDLRLSDGDVRAAKRRWIEGAPEEERAYLREYAEVAELPGSRPAYLHFVPDPSDGLWISEYAVRPGGPSEEGVSAWRVFDADGVLLAEVRTPAGLRIHDVGEDWVLGVRRGALDVESVVLHPLLSSPASSGKTRSYPEARAARDGGGRIQSRRGSRPPGS